MEVSTTRTLGTDDAVNTCECCGRANLKFTVVMEQSDGRIVHYGQVCAVRNTGKDRRTQSAEAQHFQSEQRAAARGEFQAHAAFKAERARFAARDALPVDHPARLGRAAADFVREACELADLVCRQVVSRYRAVSYWEIRT